MWHTLKSPLVRISFGLSMLTISMLMLSEMFGLVPDTKDAEIESRKVMAESLAVLLSTAIADGQMQRVEETLRAVVTRNSAVLSAAVRMQDGTLRPEFGGHVNFWILKPDDDSTPTQIQVPLYRETTRWGTVELRFKPLMETFTLGRSFLALVLFVGVAGFIAYLIFLRQSLRELNPDAVIPERVRKALDTLSEGLLILDKKGYIMFANLAFANKTGIVQQQLIGKVCSRLDWEIVATADAHTELPWLRVLQGQPVPNGIRVRLQGSSQATYTFAVNVSPINAAGAQIKGALITFDDITEIELKNDELSRAIGKLENSQREISRQNQELQILAARDPLTGILNRRSLFQGFEALFAEAKEEGELLSCIMVDIDHFKLVNDRFGHAEGDKVIKYLSAVLTENTRPNDLVGRFGGEEFCVILPGIDAEATAEIAERIRQIIQAGVNTDLRSELRITSSFGVTDLADAVRHHEEMVERADKALYAAKESGRNRVVKWSKQLERDTAQGDVTAATEHAATTGDEGTETPNIQAGTKAEQGAPRLRQADADRTQQAPSNVVSLYPQGTDARPLAAVHKNRPSDTPVPSGDALSTNSMLLIDRIDQAMKRSDRSDTQIAVMVIDVDALQRVSDTLGLAVNKKLAKAVVARIKSALRGTDTAVITKTGGLAFNVSVFGRSEIVVVLSDLKHNGIVTSIVQRIFRLNNDPIEIDGDEFFLNSKVGVSLYPVDGAHPDTLIRNASSAMRQVKDSTNRNECRFYTEEINRQSKQQIRLETGLHHALTRNEFILYYQPIIDLNTGCVLSMEALIRWRHPQWGLVPPDDFIPLAQQMGIIPQISVWTVASACQQLNSWRAQGYSDVSIAVNLSPVEFRNPDLAENIIRLVDDHGLPATAFSLEITETAAIQNVESAIGVVQSLHAAGFDIALDDFGTGYSSLIYLKQFPLNKMKIDRSFIAGLTTGTTDAALVRAAIAMGQNLGLRVVAEGVETAEQLRCLQDLQCDEIQGYLISKPVAGEDTAALLAQPCSVQRQIDEYGAQHANLAGHQGLGSVTSMMGLLNNVPR